MQNFKHVVLRIVLRNDEMKAGPIVKLKNLVVHIVYDIVCT